MFSSLLEPFAVEVYKLYDKLVGDQKYLPAITANVSPTYLGIISSTILTVLVTMYLTSRNDKKKEDSGKSPTGKGILRKGTTAKNVHQLTKKTSFVVEDKVAGSTGLLDVPKPNQKFMNKSPPPSPRGTNSSDNDEESDLEDTSSSRSEQLLSKAKKARFEAMKRATEKEKKLTESELQEEKQHQNEQLAQIFSLLSKNEDKFGKLSYEDLQNQMTMYKS